MDIVVAILTRERTIIFLNVESNIDNSQYFSVASGSILINAHLHTHTAAYRLISKMASTNSTATPAKRVAKRSKTESDVVNLDTVVVNLSSNHAGYDTLTNADHPFVIDLPSNNVIDLTLENEDPQATATTASLETSKAHPLQSLLGKHLVAPHKFFYKLNPIVEGGIPCPISVRELFGKVVALPTEENEECFRIEWLGLQRDGPYGDIPEVLRPYLCPLFAASKYGSYIQDLVEFTELLHQDRQMSCTGLMFRLRPTSPSTSSGDSVSNYD